jgi:hypothetical protein
MAALAMKNDEKPFHVAPLSSSFTIDVKSNIRANVSAHFLARFLKDLVFIILFLPRLRLSEKITMKTNLSNLAQNMPPR